MLPKNIKIIYNTAIIYIALLLLSASCGFKPLYKLNSNIYDSNITSIKVQASNKKYNQILKNNLYDIMNPKNIESDFKYLLKFDISKNINSTYTTQTGSSGRNRVTINVNYVMTDIVTKKIIVNNDISLSENYDITSNRYASHKMEEYKVNNLLKIIAKDIRNDIIQQFYN
jgi:hypothetical protein